MCHRQLRFYRSQGCGHLTFTGETNVDCAKQDCFISTAHPKDCAHHSPGRICRCKRYYTQPERIVTQENEGDCPICVNHHSRHPH